MMEKKSLLDPRTKLILMIIISMITISGDIQGYHYWIRVLLEMIIVALLYSNQKYYTSTLAFALFTFASLCEGTLVHVSSGTINILIFFLTGIISRMVVGIMMGYYVMTSTSVSEFVTAMERMHISQKIIVPVSVMFRFFPTIAEEYQSIRMAMKMRGLTFYESNGLLSMIEYRLIPVMMSTVKIGSELSASALTKGLGNQNKRTNLCSIGFGIADLFALSFAIFIVVLYQLT